MPAIEVKPGIHWIGVNDRTTDLFEGMWPITQEGVSYNSYLVIDEKKALVDLANTSHAGTLLDQITDVIDPSTLDYVVINHMEPDHTGAINLLCQVAPNVTFLCSAKAAPMLEAFYGVSPDHVQVMEEGQEVSLGAKTLQFLMIPFVHWPETMATYEREQRVAMTGDAFGGFGALRGAIFDENYPDMTFYRAEALRYFSNIVAKYSTPVLRAIDKLSKMPVDVIAPSHGLLWRQNPQEIVDMYGTWSGYAATGGLPGVTLIYGSMYGNTEEMMNAVAAGISSAGVPLGIFDAARTHASYILAHLWQYRGVMIGAPTYEAGVFPPVAQALGLITEKRVMRKMVARFGSYGWSGGGQRAVETILEPLKWQWSENLEFRGAPTRENLHQGEEFGKRFAESLLEGAGA